MTLGTEYDIKHRHELDRQDLLLPGQIGPWKSSRVSRHRSTSTVPKQRWTT